MSSSGRSLAAARAARVATMARFIHEYSPPPPHLDGLLGIERNYPASENFAGEKFSGGNGATMQPTTPDSKRRGPLGEMK